MALATSPASAAILVEQPPLDDGVGYYASPNSPQQMADDFNLGTAASLESITWWGGYDGNIDAGDDDFLVRLYSSMAGTGTVLVDFGSVSFSRTPTALLDVAGNEVYQYDFALGTPIALSSGTHFLFVQNLGTSDWFWQEASSGNGDLWFRGEDTDSWASSSGDPALRIEGTPAQAPEPSSLALLGIAGLSMVLAGRRRQRQAA
jgi:hypothetical protein